MSSEQKPPRKKQKCAICSQMNNDVSDQIRSDTGSSRVLRSQASVEHCKTDSNKSSPTPSPVRKSRSRQLSIGKTMSESRRKTSRKTRNDELRENEQLIAASSASGKATSRRPSSAKRHDTPSKNGFYTKDLLTDDASSGDEEDDAEMEEDHLNLLERTNREHHGIYP